MTSMGQLWSALKMTQVRFDVSLLDNDCCGGTENAGVENAGVENVRADRKGGTCRSGKCGSR